MKRPNSQSFLIPNNALNLTNNELAPMYEELENLPSNMLEPNRLGILGGIGIITERDVVYNIAQEESTLLL